MTAPTPGPPQCAISTPSPPAAPDRLDSVVDVVNPGGDPAVLRRAAGAWREMAAHMRSTTERLAPGVREVGITWRGLASQEFGTKWEEQQGWINERARVFEEVAEHLDQVAGQIEETNEQIHQLFVAIGATVVLGAVSSVLSFGFASAPAAAVVAAQTGQAAAIVVRLGTFLTISARTMSGFRAALLAFSQRWAIAAVANTLATGAQKAISNPNHNPLDNWRISDLTKITVGATAASGVAGAAGHSARFSSLAVEHPLRASFATSALGGAGGSVVNDLWVDRRGLGANTLRNAMVNGVSSGLVGVGTQGVLLRLAGRPSPGSSLQVPRLDVVPSAQLPKPGLARLPRLWVPDHLSREAMVGLPLDTATQVGVGVAAPLVPPPPVSEPRARPWDVRRCTSPSSTGPIFPSFT
ncbi:MAG: WXG100 family type VII secretion target [Actinomycetota bacterium]|nr:WXG100 family type VII secretion target [Actinomycetota bacterium]MDQ3575329.1 WXG100 family type VII secretion target [Actinomycetota bacterium]